MKIKCFHHPESEAEDTCMYCGRSLCADCLLRRNDYCCCKDEENCLEYQDGDFEPPSYTLIPNAHSLLDTYLDRLAEVRDELDKVMAEFDELVQSLEKQNDAEQREVEKSRKKIKGFQAFHMAQENMAIISLMQLIIEYFNVNQEAKDDELIRRVDEGRAQMDELTPRLKEIMNVTEPFQSVDFQLVEKAMSIHNGESD
ncbi:MAG: hypothetical protein SVY10_00565 [Thermodesulfobacteriota bacterium]|nr:hypothetical protein [Thermodesulfobacteriota bacterium]